jgi:Uma2 family endonuclease
MLEAGILHEDDRLELIDGQLIVMSPTDDPHVACVNRLNRLFVERTDPDIVVSVQNPVRIDEHNEPEPDLVLSTSVGGAPHPATVLLLVEVSGSSLAYDRQVKRPLYARAEIPEVWIVNLQARQIEVFRELREGTYRTQFVAKGDDSVVPARLSAVGPVAVRPLLETLPDEEDR